MAFLAVRLLFRLWRAINRRIRPQTAYSSSLSSVRVLFPFRRRFAGVIYLFKLFLRSAPPDVATAAADRAATLILTIGRLLDEPPICQNDRRRRDIRQCTVAAFALHLRALRRTPGYQTARGSRRRRRTTTTTNDDRVTGCCTRAPAPNLYQRGMRVADREREREREGEERREP